MTENSVAQDEGPVEHLVTAGNYTFKITQMDEGAWFVFSLHDKREEFEFDEVSLERAQELALKAGEFWTLCDDAERPIWKSVQDYWNANRDTPDGFDEFVFRVFHHLENKVRVKAGRDLDSLLEEE